MIHIKSKLKIARGLTAIYLLTFAVELLLPVGAYALTSGPSQPEVQSFEPAGTTDMVNTFSGSFTYNIPLFELPGPNGGYPFNLAYHSGTSMDDEATWVGLGWSLNPGVVNRNMQALPDDFKGDKIKTELDIKDNWTVSTGFNMQLPEIWSFDLDKAVSESAGAISVGMNLRYNSYQGFGCSHSVGLDLKGRNASASIVGGAGLGISMDSDDGAGLNLNASLGGLTGKNQSGGNLTGSIGLGISSRTGLKNLSLGLSYSKDRQGTFVGKTKDGKYALMEGRYSSSVMSGSGDISFSATRFSPQVSMPMKGFDLSLAFKLGGDAAGVFGYVSFSAAFSMEKLRYNSKESEAYGYIYLHEANGKETKEAPSTLLDLSREKDGMVTRNTPNLAVPHLTYDVYSVVGQGMITQFRPYRNDIGAIYDEYTKSASAGGGIGVEFGGGQPFHVGINGDVHYSESWSGKWQKNNDFSRGFIGPQANIDFENVYYRSTGEPTAESSSRMVGMIGGEEAIKLDLDGTRDNPKLTNNFSNRYDASVNVLSNDDRRLQPRKPRANPVMPLTNDQLNGLKEFDISYYSSAALVSPSAATYKSISQVSLNRGNRNGYAGVQPIGHHIGGIAAINADGMKYVYGIPAYNNKHVESTFSIDHAPFCDQQVDLDVSGSSVNYKKAGTDKYKIRTQMPPYAHSYLLTSILGPDYIDVDGNGPSENDFGYWVKFNYVKASDGYKWRAPYQSDKGTHHTGYESDHYDDKASYMYGEKEMWYLATAETKTHIAAFIMSPRQDAQGALAEVGTITTTAASYKLDRIELYLKKSYETSTPKPIQTTYFEYDYSLCGNVPNNSGANETVNGVNINAAKGKLTLKKLYFKHESNAKGALSPYQFEYGKLGGETINPDYDPTAYDRWGQYRDVSDACDKVISPYVNQSLDEDTRNEYATAWNLTTVHMPSGADINVSYESNDYAYVQDKTAMQMFGIKSMFDPSNPGLIYNKSTWANNEDGRKVYFELTNPVSTSASTSDKNKELAKYLDGTGQIFYKLHAYMRKGDDENHKEFVSGYADIDDIGIDDNCIDPGNTNNYRWAYIILKKIKVNKTERDYHPFAFYILQSLKTNLPHFAFRDGGLIQEQAPDGGEAVLEIIKAMGAAFASIKELFTGYYKEKTGSNHQWASRLVIGESFIRLNNVIGRKYGGGARVKSIAIADNWNAASGDASSSYGQYYDYTTEENGKTISSGVATFEPAIGGEENALRYAKNYPQKISIMSQNNLFYEYPINESLYPAPSVGYSKVTVTSLNTKRILANDGDRGYGSTGITENYFYTAKDYPVITSETDLFSEKDSKSMKYLRLPIPLPGFGNLNWDIMAASQGYVIQLNDMHGKPRKIVNYGLDGTGRKTAQVISSVEYFYFDELKKFKKPGREDLTTYRVLKSEVPVLVSDPDPTDLTRAKIDTMPVGIDYELLTDQRQSMSYNVGGGLSFNIELLIPVAACTFPWPNINYNENDLRLAVTNKVIHRTGILRKVIATDGQSIVSTENLCFDRYTGTALLTTVTNNFDDKVWAYSIPAHHKYDGMGTAYKNMGLRIQLPCANLSSTNVDSVYKISALNACQYLAPGDEFVMAGGDKAIVLMAGADSATFMLTGNTPLTVSGTTCSSSSVVYDMYLVRSGRRNQLNTKAGKIVAIKDPTKGREIDPCEQKIYIPKEYEDNCDLGIYGTGTIPYGLLTMVDSVAMANGDTIEYFFPFSHPVFSGMPAALLSRMLAMGYIGIHKKDNIINISNTNGSSCRWALYNRCSFTPNTVFAGPYLPSYLDSSNLNCSDSTADVPTTYNGYTLVGLNERHMLYQKPYNCLCTEVLPPLLVYDSVTYNDTAIVIDSVINSSVSTYADQWDNDFKDARFENDENSLATTYLNGMDGYLSGTRGIWRNWMNFVYHTDRRQSSSLIKTRVDGTYRMGLFKWEEPLTVHCDSNWVRANEITRYDAYNHDVENRDALGIYSAALYSFKGKLPVAVGVNTKYSEFGFEGFEEYDAGVNYHQYNNATSNIDVLTHKRAVSIVDPYCQTVYSFLQGWGFTNSSHSFFTTTIQSNIPIGYTYSNVEVLQYFGHMVGGSHVSNHFSYPYTITHTGILDNKSHFSISPSVNPLGVSGIWLYNGEVRIPRCIYISGSVTAIDNQITGVEVSETKAHTGRRSIKITGSPTFKQYQLTLDMNKSYNFSAWLSRDEAHAAVSTYKQNHISANANCSVEIVALDAADNPVGILGRFEPSGSMVNQWQKVEGEFMVTDPSVKSVAIRLYSGTDGSSDIVAYFDDVRIYPTDGNMKSYVYNNRNYRLAATLDDNNYATFYYYDEEGNLYLTKQETEKGIYTIQETKANMPR